MSRRPVVLSKQQLRAQSESAMKEAMERKITIQHIDSRKDAQCAKCGAFTKVNIEPGKSRAGFKCQECGHRQMTL